MTPKPPDAVCSFPLVENSAAHAAAAGSAKDWASTAASVAVCVDIAGIDSSVPVMAAAASSLPSSDDAPQAGECTQAVATCNIDANQIQAKSKSSNSNKEKSRHVLISFSMPNASSENPK